jgi:hypothetical protein
MVGSRVAFLGAAQFQYGELFGCLKCGLPKELTENRFPRSSLPFQALKGLTELFIAVARQGHSALSRAAQSGSTVHEHFDGQWRRLDEMPFGRWDKWLLMAYNIQNLNRATEVAKVFRAQVPNC